MNYFSPVLFRLIFGLVIVFFPLANSVAANTEINTIVSEGIDAGDNKFFVENESLGEQITPNTERYFLYELRDLRKDLEHQKYEILQEVVNRQFSVMDRSLSYTSGVVNFFWFVVSFITFTLAILALLGWKSLGDVKVSVKAMVETEAREQLKKSQDRLQKIEADLKRKEQEILKNQEELQRIQKLSTLWLQVNRERDDRKRLEMLDTILEMEDSVDAYVMKAGSYARLHIAEKAIEMANIALQKKPDQSLAHFHRAWGYALLHNKKEAIADLNHAFTLAPSLRKGIMEEPVFRVLHSDPDFKRVIKGDQ